jgi:hypothetical protein
MTLTCHAVVRTLEIDGPAVSAIMEVKLHNTGHPIGDQIIIDSSSFALSKAW